MSAQYWIDTLIHERWTSLGVRTFYYAGVAHNGEVFSFPAEGGVYFVDWAFTESPLCSIRLPDGKHRFEVVLTEKEMAYELEQKQLTKVEAGKSIIASHALQQKTSPIVEPQYDLFGEIVPVASSSTKRTKTVKRKTAPVDGHTQRMEF